MNTSLNNMTRTGMLIGFLSIATMVFGFMGNSIISIVSVFVLLLSIRLINYRSAMLIAFFFPIIKEFIYPSKVVIIVVFSIFLNILFVITFDFLSKLIRGVKGDIVALIFLSVANYRIEYFYTKSIMPLYLFDFYGHMPIQAFRLTLVSTTIIRLLSGLLALYITYIVSNKLYISLENTEDFEKDRGDKIGHKLFQH